jgi:hypothetical protein
MPWLHWRIVRCLLALKSSVRPKNISIPTVISSPHASLHRNQANPGKPISTLQDRPKFLVLEALLQFWQLLMIKIPRDKLAYYTYSQ